MSGNSGKRKQETDDISVPICSHTHVGVIKVPLIKVMQWAAYFGTQPEISGFPVGQFKLASFEFMEGSKLTIVQQ